MRDPVRIAAGRVAYYSRREQSAEDLADARRLLAIAQIEKAVTDAFAAAPPLSPSQLDRLSRFVLAGGGAR